MKPFAWSYSALTRFEDCPKKQWHLGIKKDFKDDDSQWAADGKFIHTALFKRVVGGDPLPLSLRHLEEMAKRFDKAEGDRHGEMKLALNRNMEPVDFFASDVWVRAIIDLLIVFDSIALVIDWKTGKVKDDFTQLGLAIAILSRWMPEIETFRGTFVWTTHKKISPPKAYCRSDIQQVWNDILPRVAKMEEAYKTTDFPARESPLCAWCPVNTCPHWKDGR